MLIIAGYLTVDAAHRDAFVAAHADLVRRARQTPGCHDLAITADPVDPTRVNNYERWESWEDIQAWRAIADAPDTGIPIVADDVAMYDASGERPPF
ncbi:putative quinol monooxygenase [Brevibacterium renqingii]|uniref:putative quinol monooxygenase n=1 Tax=Brevibacterium renqingii TaxID=2776916 RepID=UPI001AE08FE7|nr:antibiotic biosynthesis monooxygenase family protein [Brevibacterium renqingii]